jgi:hypothetical protein
MFIRRLLRLALLTALASAATRVVRDRLTAPKPDAPTSADTWPPVPRRPS